MQVVVGFHGCASSWSLAESRTHMNLMRFMGLFGLGGGGVFFLYTAFQLRKQGRRWILPFAGACIMIVLALVSLVTGISL